MMNLQIFAEAVQGKDIVYLYRVHKNAASADAVAMAFVTENTRTKTRNSTCGVFKSGREAAVNR